MTAGAAEATDTHLIPGPAKAFLLSLHKLMLRTRPAAGTLPISTPYREHTTCQLYLLKEATQYQSDDGMVSQLRCSIEKR
jgi:hypothetical protein